MADKLTLDDFAPARPQVEYQGKTYHIKAQEDMSLSDLGWFKRTAPRVQELFDSFQADTIEDAEIDELEKTINQLVGKVSYDIPEDVRAELTFEQKMKLLDFFTANSLKEKQKT